MRKRIQVTAATILVALGAVVFAAVLHQRYPVTHWLAWRYFAEWLLALGWAGACVALGHVVIRKGLSVRMPLREHLVLSMAVGVVGFGIGVFVAGILGGLGTVFFIGCPTLLVGTCGPALFLHLRDRYVRLEKVPRSTADASSWVWLARGFGAVGVAIVALQIMTPHNVSFDSRWYHLAIAESYAATGQIMRFREGWFLGTLPQLATWLYTWAFLCPRVSLAFRMELAAHVEMVLFLWTLGGIPIVVRWLTKGANSSATWAALFLFPGIFVYDSNLNLSADHVLAFWALPLLMIGRRLFPAAPLDRQFRFSVLFGLVLSGALLTKYQVLYLLVGLGFLLVSSTTDRIIRSRATLAPTLELTLRRLAVIGGVVAVLTAPHWLKNLLWHHNPVYPFARDLFSSVPWTAGTKFQLLDSGWVPEGSLWHRLRETARATFMFSLEPHDWPIFHRDLPVFGSLFTLLALPSLLVAPTRRLAGLIFATMIGVATWYWTYHQDRYLQSLLPWMVVVTAAAILGLWRAQSKPLQAALALLVSLQIVWAVDLPALPTHAMAGRSILSSTLDRISSGYREAFSERDDPGTNLHKVSAALPQDAVPLLHEEHLRLGLGRWVVSDSFGRQGAIRYRNWDTRQGLYNQLKSLGVTHILAHSDPSGEFSVADNIVFFDLLGALRLDREVEGYRIFSLQAPPTTQRADLLGSMVVGCKGLQTVRTLSRIDDAVRKLGEGDCKPDLKKLAAATQHVRFVIVSSRLDGAQTHLGVGWKELIRHNDILVFGRSE